MYTPIHPPTPMSKNTCVSSLLLMSFILSLFTLVFFVVAIFPILQHFDHLISTQIPNQLDFYHQLAVQHNQTLTQIEISINDPILFQEIKSILSQVQRITSELNITQIQNDIHQISTILGQIIHH